VLVLAMVAPVFAQETLEIGTTEEGRLRDNTVTYSFTVSTQRIIVFSLNSEDFDSFLQIESTDGEVLKTDDDGGDGLNARIVFVAPEAGDYRLTVRSYSGDGTGAYVLNSMADVGQLYFGEPMQVDLARGAIVQMFFVAEINDVINLSAVALNENVDTNLTLVAPDGLQVDFSEDARGLNPYISHAVLPQSGLYSVTLAPYAADDFGKLNLLLERTELSMLSADPLKLKFTEGVYEQIIGLNIVDGALYNITLAFESEVSASVALEGSDYEGYGYFSVTAAEGVSYLYRAKETGLVEVTLTNSTYDLPVGFTITAVVVGE